MKIQFSGHLLLAAAALFCTAPSSRLYSQQSTGMIIGAMRDISKEVEPGVVVRLLEISTRTTLQEVKPETSGRFVFRNVPFGSYDLRVFYDTDILATRRVIVRSSVPIIVSIDSLQEFQQPEMLVTANRFGDRQSELSSSTTYTAASVATLPASSSTKQIETLLLDTPGVVPDEDGRMHVRGEDAQLQYVIDGIPITGNMRVSIPVFSMRS